ncbi:hypothetical protein M9458_054167 [Cirrhinus mrigala]|uniref:ribonuclease H n=1 Tax=Cirrhinus mrigala TaxID=683832 RepID=A0ABD0ML30_CIRMR
MAETLLGLEGVSVYMGDILVYGDTMEQHDQRLTKVLERIESAGLKLNREKCPLRQQQLHFLGHLIDKSGVRPDPKKETAFQRIKDILSTSPVLTFYNVSLPTAVSADASGYGGGVLLQLHDGDWKPVAYCSLSLSKAETRYAQIEKECLASIWVCEKFEKYLIGLENFKLVTDHKPLVPLMNKEDLDNVPLRCERLLMKLMRFKLTAEYAPGKTLLVADTLSRNQLACKENDLNTHSDVECYIAAVAEGLPASPLKLEAIRAATMTDNNLQIVLKYIRSGWPNYVDNIPVAIR